MILVVGDSLSLPRDFDEVTYKSTWPWLLSCNLENCPVINLSSGGATSADCLDTWKRYTHYYKPKLIVFQFGIVDATARVFSVEPKL